MIDVLFVVLPDTLLLDLAGPAEALRLANQQCLRRRQPPAFRLRYVGPAAQTASSVGVALAGLEALPASLPPRCWVVLLGRPGGADDVVRHERAWLDTRDWLARRVAPQLVATDAAPDVRLLTVCSGALLAADAGLLHGRRVTTHHELLDALTQRAPTATVLGNRVFVDDGAVLSSAGVTAGIDLALYLVGQTCGAALAGTVAQTMVAFARRGPLDPQRSPLLAHRDHLHPAVHRVQDAVCAAPTDDWTAERLAGAAHVTPRHLARLFREHVGLSPRDYVEHVRSALARHALAGGVSATQAAELAGFGSPRRLRRALARSPASTH